MFSCSCVSWYNEYFSTDIVNTVNKEDQSESDNNEEDSETDGSEESDASETDGEEIEDESYYEEEDASENENTLSTCQQSCDNASQSCQAFTYNPTTQQCLLLETPKPGTFSPDAVAYYLASSSPSFLSTQFNMTPDTSIDSTGLIGTPYTAISSTDCQTTCQSTS
jgi:hypothetical protein